MGLLTYQKKHGKKDNSTDCLHNNSSLRTITINIINAWQDGKREEREAMNETLNNIHRELVSFSHCTDILNSQKTLLIVLLYMAR